MHRDVYDLQSCKELAKTLYECMEKTECVKRGGDIRSCMKEETECTQYRTAYFECRRGALDMRTRIQGPKAY